MEEDAARMRDANQRASDSAQRKFVERTGYNLLRQMRRQSKEEVSLQLIEANALQTRRGTCLNCRWSSAAHAVVVAAAALLRCSRSAPRRRSARPEPIPFLRRCRLPLQPPRARSGDASRCLQKLRVWRRRRFRHQLNSRKNQQRQVGSLVESREQKSLSPNVTARHLRAD